MILCPSREQLQQLLADQLGKPIRETIEEHVEACAACAEILASLTDQVDTVDRQCLRSGRPAPLPDSDATIVRYLKANPPEETALGLDEAGSAEPIRFPGPRTEKGPLGQLDSYHIRRVLGQGRFGIVYEASDELNRLVALKVLKPELAASDRERLRFAHEARKAAAVKHDHIVTIHHVGHTPAFPLPYLVMEYVDGEPLSHRLERQGELQAKEAARIVQQVALALAAAHERGLVHRDIKPSNILLEAGSGRAKLTDFGLARAPDAGGGSTSQSGRMVGSPAYMSPEQIVTPRHIDGRSDIYSLGVVLYELLTGERPFRGAAHLLVQQVVHEEPRPPRKLNDHIPRDLETICQKAMAKFPARRYATACELADDVRRFLNGQPIQARPVGQLERLWRWSKRNLVVASLTAAVFVLLAAVAGVASLGYLREAEQRTAAEAAESSAKSEAKRAQMAEQEMRRQWYAASINAMHQAWDSGQVLRLRALLAETEAYPDRSFEWYYWARLCHLELHTFIGHRALVSAVSWSPDGKLLATGSDDGTAKVWELAVGRELLTLQGHTSAVRCVSWSPDGKRLATGSADGTAKVWQAASGRELLTFRGHRHEVWSVSWSPDGKRLVSGSRDGRAKVWDAAGGRELFTLKGHTFFEVAPVSWSPDGKRLAMGSGDGTATVWEAAGGRELLTLKGHLSEVASVSWSPDGKRLATGSRDGTAKVWEISAGRGLLTLKGHLSEVYSVSWAPDGKRLITGSKDGTAKVWDAARGQELFTLKGHTSRVRSVSWSPDGKLLATGSVDGTAKVWDAGGESEPFTFKGHMSEVRSVSWSPDGKRLATGSDDGTAKVWETAAGRELLTLQGHTSALRSVSWSPDGKRLATGSVDGTAKLWEITTGRQLLTLQGRTSIEVWSVSWSPDGKRLATGSDDGTVKVWEAAGDSEPLTLHCHSGRIPSVSWSPDGKRLATGSVDGTAKLWEITTGRELLTLQGHTNAVRCVSWSPDGKRLATGSVDGTAKVWEIAAGRELLTLQSYTSEVSSVSWSPNGKRLATGSEDGTAKVWEIAAGRELLTLQGHTSALRSVSWSPDGKRLATGSVDGTAKVWEAAGAEAVREWARQDQARDEFLALNAFRGPHAQGFIRAWLLLLPLSFASSESGGQALDRQQVPGEVSLRPKSGQSVPVGSRELVWREYHSPDAIVDFNAVLGQVTDRSVAYAVCYVESERARKDLWLQVSCDDQSKVYLNGREVYHCRLPRWIDRLDTIGPVVLEQGTNVLLFKVVNEYVDWQGCVRLVDAAGRPAQDIRIKLTP
jgi:WD40 repeat protein